MTDKALPTWERPHLQPGGGDAHLYYKVHGHFDGGLKVSRSQHRCSGVPDGLTLKLYRAEKHPEVMAFGTDGLFVDDLTAMGPEASTKVTTATGFAILRGAVEQPDTLDYFRDTVGLVQALMESGGVAVFDPFQLKWWTAEEWSTRAFVPAGSVPRHHVVILFSDENDGTRWYHTRGMLKFGRPDISVHGVTPDQHAAVQDLCNRLIERMAFGAVVPDGQVIRMAGLPEWTCRTLGNLDDPDFNNRRIEIGP
jgi:hypothetical protein